MCHTPRNLDKEHDTTLTPESEAGVSVVRRHHPMVWCSRWLNVPMLLGLILSGKSIYRASPISFGTSDQRQASVVTEFVFNGTEAVTFGTHSSRVLEGPGFVSIRTLWPSGFSRATCLRPAAVVCEWKRCAPRLILRE